MVALPASTVSNPKLDAAEAQWFRYYAGYSPAFVRSTLLALELSVGARILDPWLGGGTTGWVARESGHTFVGIELSPVMAIVSQARMSATAEVIAQAKALLDHMRVTCCAPQAPDHGLNSWIGEGSARFVLSLVGEISQLPVSEKSVWRADWAARIPLLSESQVLLLAALLTAVRAETKGLFGSNPTWPKRPSSAFELVPDQDALIDLIRKSLDSLPLSSACPTMDEAKLTCTRSALSLPGKGSGLGIRPWCISVGSSTSIPFPATSIDAVVTSPPYCTRIDYGKKTEIELACLGLYGRTFRAIREEMIGTPTIGGGFGSKAALCKPVSELLRSIARHKSYAAKEYYLKFYRQYFTAMSLSISEIARVLKPGGKVALVAQTSHFKDVRIDLPNLIASIATAHGLHHLETLSWSATTNLANINGSARGYVKDRSDVESVVVLGK